MPEASRPDVLAAILGATRRIVEVRKTTTPAETLERGISGRRAAGRRFLAALTAPERLAVIAECKRRSPSRGILRQQYAPAAIARSYEENGAAAVSVLTEPTFFDGSPEHLKAVRAEVSLPLLRKDFIVDRYQLLEARAWGADAVLLIVAALSDEALGTLLRDCASLELEALVEVHDAEELKRALAAGAAIVGVNNRNLNTLGVDLDTCERLVDAIPDEVVAVAESGLRRRSDLQRLAGLGFDAFLVGERLMTAADPGAALRGLL